MGCCLSKEEEDFDTTEALLPNKPSDKRAKASNAKVREPSPTLAPSVGYGSGLSHPRQPQQQQSPKKQQQHNQPAQEKKTTTALPMQAKPEPSKPSQVKTEDLLGMDDATPPSSTARVRGGSSKSISTAQQVARSSTDAPAKKEGRQNGDGGDEDGDGDGDDDDGDGESLPDLGASTSQAPSSGSSRSRSSKKKKKRGKK